MPDLYISKLKMPNNNEYLIKDAALTSRVDALETASLEVKIYDTLPTASAETMHYLALVQESGSTTGTYVEYVTVKSGSSAPYTYTWERIGTTSTDLADYLKASEVTTATGTVTVESENHSHTYNEATGVTNTAASADVTVNSFNYTPVGDVTIETIQGATFNTGDATFDDTPTSGDEEDLDSMDDDFEDEYEEDDDFEIEEPSAEDLEDIEDFGGGEE